jgi:hypothetical protein
LNGVRLTFTDATALPDGGLLFLAVAEATESTYEDGAVEGSAVGWLDSDGSIVRIDPLSPSIKAEGIALYAPAGGTSRILLVTDDDDPSRPSSLYAALFTP